MKPVLGYEKYFSVTPCGKVFSHRSNKWLKLCKNSDGYLVFATKIGGRSGINKLFRVHRLVAIAYIENPENKPEINHIDGDKSNNHMSNLEWVTGSENMYHAYSTRLIDKKLGIHRYGSKFTKEDVEYIKSNPMKLSLRELGKRFGVHHKTISKYTKVVL